MNIRKKPKKLRLKEWSKLESIKKKIKEVRKRGGYLPIADLIIDAINLCGIRGNFKKKHWIETVAVFSECQQANSPSISIPMMRTKEKGADVPWDYSEREWYWWVNTFASAYGWSEERIAELDVNDAIALYQEILVADQMEKEFRYGLSELAYEYVPATKKSRFKPLPRPDWMLVTKENHKPKQPKKTKILATMLPQGNIVNLDEEKLINFSE